MVGSRKAETFPTNHIIGPQPYEPPLSESECLDNRHF